MKKFIMIFILSISVLLIGCVDGDVTLDIEKDGNANLYIKLLTNEYLANSITENELKEIKENYKIDDIKKINESEKSGYLISKDLGNLMESNDLKEDDKTKELLDINTKQQLFFTTYEIDIKLKDIVKNNILETKNPLFEYIGNKSNINFCLKTPYKLIESNATSIDESNNKTVYNWSYTLSNIENIYVKFKIINIMNILISIAIVLIIIILGIYMYKRKK